MRHLCSILRACGVVVTFGCAFMAGPALGSNRDRLAEDATIRHVTATGVRVLVRGEPGSGLVAIVAVVDTGEADRRAAAGVKEIVARSVFGAGANLSAEGVAREVYRSGGSVASVTSPDCIALRCMTTPNAVRDAVYLIGQALKNAVFDAETVRRAAAAVDRDRAMAAQPLSIGAAVARAKLFAGHPYGVLQLPSDRTPRSLAVVDLLRYYRTAFVPAGTTIAVVGDIEPRAAIQMVDNQMVDYDRRSAATRPPAGPSSDDHGVTGRDVERVTVRASTTAVVAASKAPGRTSSDAAAVRVLAALVGEGKASRLFRAIRDVRGIGYVVGAETQLWRSGGMLMAYVERSSERTQSDDAASADGDVSRPILGVLDSIAERPPDEIELERAKRYVVGSRMRSVERTLDLAQALAEAELLDGDWRRAEDFAEAVRKVTVADVVRVAGIVLPHGIVVSVSGSGSDPESR